MSLTDAVEAMLCRHLPVDRNLQRYTSAKTDAEAVQGKLVADDYRAAMALKLLAARDGEAGVFHAKDADVVHALRLALNRIGKGRNGRGRRGLWAKSRTG